MAIDSSGFINGWNAKVAELIGLLVGETMGWSLVKNLILEDFIELVEGMLYVTL